MTHAQGGYPPGEYPAGGQPPGYHPGGYPGAGPAGHDPGARPGGARPWDGVDPSAPSYLQRNVLWGMGTLTVVVLGFSYHTSLSARSPDGGTITALPSRSAQRTAPNAAPTPPPTSAPTRPGRPGATPSQAVPPPSAPTQGATRNPAAGLKDGTFTGTAMPTRFGPVQVRIVVSGGRVTSSQAIRYPNTDRKDQQINSRAVPVYNAAAVAAQSADIDSISGATVTWQGYTGSLQSALDQARA